MKRSFRKGLGGVFALCVLLCAATGFAQPTGTLGRVLNEGVLRVGINPLFKPFSFLDDAGERVGVDLDIAERLAEGLGVRLELVEPDTFNDLIPMLEKGDIDLIMAGMSITFERAKEVDFTDAYFETGLSALVNKAKAGELGVGAVTTYDALTAKLAENRSTGRLVIAVAEGKAPAEAAPDFFPEAEIKSYPTNEAAAEATLKGEAYLMVHDEVFLKVWLRDHAAEAELRMVVFDAPFKPDAYGFAVQKGNQAFLNLLNVFIYELGSSGQSAELIGTYLPVSEDVTIRSYTVDDVYQGD